VTIKQWCPIARSAEILGDKWCLLILRELASGPSRFRELKKNIAGISMDQLTRKLDHLCALFVIVRQEFAEAPPRVEYQLTEKGRSLLPVIRRIFLWGSQEAWGRAKPGEQVDVALTLRLAATFLGQGEGALLIKVLRDETYWVTRDGAGVVCVVPKAQREGLVADAAVEIGLSDWIKIVSGENRGKTEIAGRIEGNRRVLENLLPIFRGVVFRSVASPQPAARAREITI
jgi:DNA-binding HxlR family transcriptional regulator